MDLILALIVLIVALGCLIVALGCVGLVIWAAFYAMDAWFIETDRVYGHVSSKDITEGWVDYSTMIEYDDTYHVYVRVENEGDWISVTPDFYRRINTDDRVQVDVGRGRLTNRLRIKNIYG